VRLTGLHIARHHHDAIGPPVVLLHGSPDRSKNFAPVVHRLTDLPVTVYDRRGYGKSIDAPDLGGGFDMHADDLIALMDGTPSIVVGQSAGGSIAMLAATRAPELFLSLGMWEPPMVPWTWWSTPEQRERTRSWAEASDPLALGERFNRFILGDDRWDQLAPRTQDLLRREGEAFRADMVGQAEPYIDLDRLTIPAVVGAGSVSYDVGFVAAHRRLADRCGAEFMLVEGADHYAHLSAPDAWVSLVRAAVALAAPVGHGGVRD
jgi:pimeloyl-ACP methyl ester carboxylesterase